MTAVRQRVNQFYCYLLPYIPNKYLWHDITWLIIKKTPCVIVKVIADYDYICKVIDYDYIASGDGDYDYLKSCNLLRLSLGLNFRNINVLIIELYA